MSERARAYIKTRLLKLKPRFLVLLLALALDYNFAIRIFSFASCDDSRMSLQCAVDNLSLIRIHRFECNRSAVSHDFARKSVCEIDESLFSLGSVVLCIEYNSDIFVRFLVYNIAGEALNRVEC